jgi:hypothetical protein
MVRFGDWAVTTVVRNTFVMRYFSFPRIAPRQKARRCLLFYKLFLGLATMGASVLLLPGAAMACVSSCPGGSIIVIGGFPFCSGGSNAGQAVCSGYSPTGYSPFSFLDPWGWMAPNHYPDDDDDPAHTWGPWTVGFPGQNTGGYRGNGWLGGPPVSVSL